MQVGWKEPFGVWFGRGDSEDFDCAEALVCFFERFCCGSMFWTVECGRVVGFDWRCWEGEIAGAVCRCHGGDAERYKLEVELIACVAQEGSVQQMLDSVVCWEYLLRPFRAAM